MRGIEIEIPGMVTRTGDYQAMHRWIATGRLIGVIRLDNYGCPEILFGEGFTTEVNSEKIQRVIAYNQTITKPPFESNDDDETIHVVGILKQEEPTSLIRDELLRACERINEETDSGDELSAGAAMALHDLVATVRKANKTLRTLGLALYWEGHGSHDPLCMMTGRRCLFSPCPLGHEPRLKDCPCCLDVQTVVPQQDFKDLPL